MEQNNKKRRGKYSAKNKVPKSFWANIPKPYLFGGIGGIAVLVIALIILAVCLLGPENTPADPYHFSNNLLAVKQEGKWGYMDNTGAMAISFIYEDAKPFGENGLAAVKKDGLWGYINTKGEEISGFFYQSISGYYQSLAAVEYNGRWGYINEGGMNVIPAIYEYAGNFSKNGLALVRMNGLYGYVDTNGALRIPTKYEFATPFAESGHAQISLDGRYGFIDEVGNFVILPQYNATGSGFNHNLAAVKTESGWGYVDSTGTMVIPAQFDYASDFSADGIARVMKNGEFSYINTAGAYITEMQFQDAKDFAEGFAIVTYDNLQGLMKPDGSFAMILDDKLLSQPSNGMVLFQNADGLFGYADTNDQIVISSQYAAATSFRKDGYAAVQKDGKWGLIDKTGAVILELKYEEIR